MMVGGGSKNATNKKNIASTGITDRAMYAASASAEDDSNNTDDEKKKNILPSLKGVPNSKLRGSGGASFAGNGSKKKTGDATNQPSVSLPSCPAVFFHSTNLNA